MKNPKATVASKVPSVAVPPVTNVPVFPSSYSKVHRSDVLRVTLILNGLLLLLLICPFPKSMSASSVPFVDLYRTISSFVPPSRTKYPLMVEEDKSA